MDSGSDDESLRDNNVDLNGDNLDHLALDVSNHLGEADTIFPSQEQNLENTEPFIGMEFESEDAAKLFYMAYASRIGFSVRISKSRRSRNDESIIMRRFVCSKEGFHMKKDNLDDGKKKRRRATIREGCNAMIEVIKKYYGRWVVTKLVTEHNHIVAAPSRVRYIAPEEYAHIEPSIGMEFPSHEAAQTFYYAYATRVGFDVRIRLSRRSTRDESFVMRRFVCTKEGFTPFEENGDESKRKRARAPVREGCKAMFEVIKKECDRWVVSKLVLEHSHELVVEPSKVHYIQSQSEVVVLGNSTNNCEKTTPIANSTIDTNSFIEQDLISDSKDRRQIVYGFEDTQSFLENFKRKQAENPAFFYAYQVDTDNCLTHAFWADGKAKMSYFCFGDAVKFDISYMDDKNMIPFFLFSGVNNHLQLVIFGCGLLTDFSELSFVWLLENWLIAMCGRPPVSIVSDYDDSVMQAISKVFPHTPHRLDKWHILNKVKEKLSNVYFTRPTFERDLMRCIDDSQMVDIFEIRWKALLNKYNLSECSWLEFLYNIREKWVPAYNKHIFTAEISNNHRPECLNKFFEKYFNMKTTLPVFAYLLEHALIGWHDKENLEDFATSFTRPVLHTPSNMLKQLSEIYTRTVFDIFQEEFIESLAYYADKVEDGLVCKYNVAKDEDLESMSTVMYNPSERRTSCSCCKFETSGLLCRHILRVFLTVDVRAIPDFYILKRWTKDAKTAFGDIT